MGLAQSHSRTPSRDPLPNDHQVMDVYEESGPRRGRKRKAAKGSEIEMKKVAKLNTCAYVYQKLFLQGENSDIVLAACGREWRVHKLYLKQTKFFESMFDGLWTESNSGRVQMEITDPNIDADGLNSVLGSLYHNEIEIDLDKIEGTVAAASYIVLDSVTDRCSEMMIEALSTKNAVRFYDVSTKYGLEKVREKSMEVLLHQFWKIMTDREKLNEVDRQLFVTLLNSPNLLIIEGEFDLYKVVKSWIYMREVPDCCKDDSPETFTQNASKFFKESKTSMFIKYADIFASLRIEQFLTCSETIKTVKSDALIPLSIVDEMTSALWSSLLENEESPKTLEMDDDEFFKRCIRLGRSLDSFPKCWRWIGFNFGVDLLLHVNDYSVCIKRNCLNQKAPYSVNLKSKHVLHYRLVICDSNGQILYDSGKTTWEMKPDEARTIYRMSEDLATQISVHFQYLIHQPICSTGHYVNKYLDDQNSTDDEDDEEEEDDDGDDEEDSS
ncbi:BTB domain-containing protein [Caenorhabditis elegans]|uniref:BTB domain-containing protein n=1 Tax=Caenorhabditis elegans TaxID=6239 RepID=Q9U1W5_CAEEL|nr:BTB domain-containing protein [Caenorhabditis elegans]CAB60609.1 BTB domain-containing protein [Caenorhabditis elegans]|eukprot:NP_502585.1 GCL (Drosophila Germ Cell-Less) homolog [Caenorhabditis elegans]